VASSSIAQKEEIQDSSFCRKVMVTVFWDCDGVLLGDVMPRGATINSETYINTLNKLKKRFQQISA
jgi:hypothetical protein